MLTVNFQNWMDIDANRVCEKYLFFFILGTQQQSGECFKLDIVAGLTFGVEFDLPRCVPVTVNVGENGCYVWVLWWTGNFSSPSLVYVRALAGGTGWSRLCEWTGVKDSLRTSVHRGLRRKKKKKLIQVRSIYVIIDIEFSPTSSCSQSRARINAKGKFVLIYKFWECISIVLSMTCLKMALFCIKSWVKSFEALSNFYKTTGVLVVEKKSPIKQTPD